MENKQPKSQPKTDKSKSVTKPEMHQVFGPKHKLRNTIYHLVLPMQKDKCTQDFSIVFF